MVIDKKQNWKLDLGNFIAERQDNGTFLYKAKTPTVLSSKNNITVKDKPLYPIVNDIEVDMKQQGNKMIATSVKEIEQYLLNLKTD